MRDRFFMFLFVDDENVEAYLNLAIYVANPAEKWPAHVTVAGPYPNRRSAPKRKPFAQEVNVVGVGQFRSLTQNTVFLKIFSPQLEKFWHKPDYDFNPHMTIYDGPDTFFATALYNALENLDPHFRFTVKEIERVKSIKGQSSFELYSRLRFRMLPELANLDLSQPLHPLQRISIITSAIRAAESVAQQHPRAAAAG